MKRYLIGKGTVNWSRQERITDRYGVVGLYKTDWQDNQLEKHAYLDLQLIAQLTGMKGELLEPVSAKGTYPLID